jgi:hypothetical protein
MFVEYKKQPTKNNTKLTGNNSYIVSKKGNSKYSLFLLIPKMLAEHIFPKNLCLLEIPKLTRRSKRLSRASQPFIFLWCPLIRQDIVGHHSRILLSFCTTFPLATSYFFPGHVIGATKSSVLVKLEIDSISAGFSSFLPLTLLAGAAPGGLGYSWLLIFTSATG